MISLICSLSFRSISAMMAWIDATASDETLTVVAERLLRRG